MSERAPLDEAALRERLTGARLVTGVRVVAETASTNADLLAAAGRGEPSGSVLVAEYQNAGRGRFDRTWTVPPGAGLLFSVLIRSDVDPARWGWLPLLTGLAVRAAVAGHVEPDRPPAAESAADPPQPAGSVRLKWPNDLLLGPTRRKGAGILVQASGPVAVIGVGLNVDQTADELPVETATSLRLEYGVAAPRRAELLVSILDELEIRYLAWTGADGDADISGLADEYRRFCDTIGTSVRVDRAGGPVAGTARGIDRDGAIVVDTGGGTVVLSAGDVVHLRPSAG
jgi:BirA family biotin operon repressor/biotin-[acetyl-CoA-carboxylase] ligase